MPSEIHYRELKMGDSIKPGENTAAWPWGSYKSTIPIDTRDTMVPEESDTPMTTKETILSIRKSTGLSQRRFGRRFGIPYRTIQDWEGGRRDCPLYVAEMLSALAVTDYRTPRQDEEERP